MVSKLCALLGLSLLATQVFGKDNSYVSMLPVGRQVVATVTQLGFEPEYEALMLKLTTAFAQKPEWMQAYISEHAEPGKPLPYHPDFGVSELEYEWILRNSDRSSKLVELRKIQLSVESEGDTTFRLKTIPADFPLNGVVIDRQGMWARTRDATLTERSDINQTNASSATGKWTGVQWRYEALALPDTALSVKLALGRRQQQGDGIIYLDVKSVREQRREVYHYAVLFPIVDQPGREGH